MVKQPTNSDHSNSSAGHLEYEIKTTFCVYQAAEYAES